MFSVALIGPDGAGKSTISRALAESSPFPLKVIYMGDNVESCNFALPTSRFVAYLRKRRRSGKAERSETEGKSSPPSGNQKMSLRQILWAAARLINFLAEEWSRQLLSWIYQARGYIVLYDRHFLFDFALEGIDSDVPAFERRVHRWILTRLYPRPALVIYLDSPAEVLFARKGEKTLEELEKRRQAFLHLGRQSRNFVQVDGTQPLDTVCAEICKLITEHSGRPTTANVLAGS